MGGFRELCFWKRAFPSNRPPGIGWRQENSAATRTFGALKNELLTYFSSGWMVRFPRAVSERTPFSGSLIRLLSKRARGVAEKRGFRQLILVLVRGRQLLESLIPGQPVDQLWYHVLTLPEFPPPRGRLLGGCLWRSSHAIHEGCVKSSQTSKVCSDTSREGRSPTCR
jgi:hypothetical protein